MSDSLIREQYFSMSNQLYKYFRSCEVNQNIVFLLSLTRLLKSIWNSNFPKFRFLKTLTKELTKCPESFNMKINEWIDYKLKTTVHSKVNQEVEAMGIIQEMEAKMIREIRIKVNCQLIVVRKMYEKHQNKLNEQLQSEIIAQTNCIYSNKIQNLVKKDANNQLIVTKNKIIKKLAENGKENEQQLNVPVEHSDQSSSEIPDSINYGNLDPNRLKQVRNRESARNSRARKKIYYELLEIRVKDLQDENDKLRQQCNSLQKSIETYNRQQDKFQAFLNQQQKLFERLEECMTQGKDDTEIEILLDALKYRTSSNKQERIDAAKAHSYSILDVSLPLQAKYLFSILDDRDFFSQNQKNVSEFLRDILRNIEMKPENYINNERIKLKIGLSKQNITEYELFAILVHLKIKEEIKAIQNEASKIDLLWEQLKENIKPNLLAQLLISLHQNEFRSEFQASAIFKRTRIKQIKIVCKLRCSKCY